MNKYSHGTEMILDAFFKAFESALSNYEAASVLTEQKYISQASSLSILSLEEVGKMMLLDGLLFAKTGDERYKQYKHGHLSHRMKLDGMELYPLFLRYLNTIDPRRNENRYKQTLLIIFEDLKAKRQDLADLLGDGFVFSDLDKYKQQGFYSHEAEGILKANNEAIDPKVANALLVLTWRVTDTLKFVLGQSLEYYKSFVHESRKRIDEVRLKVIRSEATKIVESIFEIDTEKS